MDRYRPEEVVAWLERHLSEWKLEDGQLVRSYQTGEWRVGVLLVGAIAFLAESLGHHPDVLLTYPRVTVHLTTHDAGGITDRDLELARRIEELATAQPDEGSVFTGASGSWVR